MCYLAPTKNARAPNKLWVESNHRLLTHSLGPCPLNASSCRFPCPPILEYVFLELFSQANRLAAMLWGRGLGVGRWGGEGGVSSRMMQQRYGILQSLLLLVLSQQLLLSYRFVRLERAIRQISFTISSKVEKLYKLLLCCFLCCFCSCWNDFVEFLLKSYVERLMKYFLLKY